jgi:hypothetical protein
MFIWFGFIHTRTVTVAVKLTGQKQFRCSGTPCPIHIDLPDAVQPTTA